VGLTEHEKVEDLEILLGLDFNLDWSPIQIQTGLVGDNRTRPYGSSLIDYVSNVQYFIQINFIFLEFFCLDVSVRLNLCLFQAHIEQWMDFAATEVDASIGKWLYPRMGFYPYAAVVCIAMWVALLSQ
jgi:hypothetical protein